MPVIFSMPSPSISNPITILGIDPGLATVGFGAIRVCGQSRQVVNSPQWGTLTTAPGQPVSTRLHELHTDMAALIAATQPDVVAIERIFHFRNVTTMVPVTQARGVLLLAIAQHGIPVMEYTPMQVKQVVTGSGRAKKGDVQDLIQHQLGLPERPRPDDAADGLALAWTHVAMRLGQTLIPDSEEQTPNAHV